MLDIKCLNGGDIKLSLRAVRANLLLCVLWYVG